MTPVPGRAPLLAAAVLALPAGAAAQERAPTVSDLPARTVSAALSVVSERAKASADSARRAHIRIGMTGAGKRELAQPLFVIDGVPLDPARSPDDLDPEDIGTVEILRGPTARETYGPRAADGVVLITTKRAAAERR